MHYFIDGYNLLFRILRNGDNLADQRRQIIEDLCQKVKILQLDVTLVFDSQYQPGDSERSYYNSLEIQYTSEGETADDFILSALKRSAHPEAQTVVTSDKHLAWLSRRRLAKTEPIEEFITWLNKRFKNKLRQSKKEKEILQEKATQAAPKKIMKRVPTSKSTVEDCYDFYLESFEKEYEQDKQQKQAKQPATPPKVKKTPKKSKLSKDLLPEDSSEKHLSETERWHTIFNKKIQDS